MARTSTSNARYEIIEDFLTYSASLLKKLNIVENAVQDLWVRDKTLDAE